VKRMLALLLTLNTALTADPTDKPSAAEISEPLSLDSYLLSLGFDFTDQTMSDYGEHLGEAQRKQFTHFMRRQPRIKNALVIGFDTGHASEILLQTCRKLRTLIAVDAELYPYSSGSIEFLSDQYKDKFFFIEEDFLEERSSMEALFPNIKFDLIYIDRKSACKILPQTMQELRAFSHSTTVLIIDGYQDASLIRIAEEAQKQKVIWLKKLYTAKEPFGTRSWLEASFRIK
jgi:hypothetical protein